MGVTQGEPRFVDHRPGGKPGEVSLSECRHQAFRRHAIAGVAPEDVRQMRQRERGLAPRE